MKTVIILILSVFFITGCGNENTPKNAQSAGKENEKIKIAFIYVGPVGDAGWTFAHDMARKELEKRCPFAETAFLESVPEGAEAERAITQFAMKGYKIIFTTSFGYMDPTINVAKKFPDTVFMHCSGYKRSENTGTYFGRMYQPKYLTGVMSGLMTKTGKIGYVAPHPIPEVIRHINAFALGLRSVNPSATVHVVWTNSWFDPGKEKEAANSLMDAGCDIIATGADSAAPMQAAAERKCYAFGYDSDGRQFAPDSFLTAPVWEWIVIYETVVNNVKNGTWKSCDYYNGMETGIVKLAPYSDLVPPEVREKTDSCAQKFIQDKFQPFTGPIRKQDGSIAYEAGVSATDSELLSMKYFVEGVFGTIPR